MEVNEHDGDPIVFYDPETKISKGKGSRGFGLFEFRDLHSAECSLQESSAATMNCIWLGISEPKPKIMTGDAEQLGIKHTVVGPGWSTVDIPPEAFIQGRMHLSQAMVKQLLPYLTHFAETGSLPAEVLDKVAPLELPDVTVKE
jgi:hypothetical protein